MYETTADLMEDHYYASLDADMEQAEFERAARESAAALAAGDCWHNGSQVGFRPVAFYSQQVGLTQGQSHCFDCGQTISVSPDCAVCDLDLYNCMGERGVGGEGKYAHDHFVTPPMVLVSVAPPEGF